MELKIIFNNPSILKGYLDQALPQKVTDQEVLSELRKNITIGIPGGIYYSLFDADKVMPHEFMIKKRSDMKAISEYFTSVEAYLRFAQEHATRFDFGLVALLGDRELKPLRESTDCSAYSIGIGSDEIHSQERLFSFIDMIVEGYQPLRGACETVTKLASAVRPKDDKLRRW